MRLLLIAALSFLPVRVWGEDPSWSEVQNVLKDPTVHTVDAFLSKLPPSLRSHFTLIHNPESAAQGGDFKNPRAILYSKDGRLMMTFNGDPSQPGYDRVETIRFEDGRFRTAEIVFPQESKVHGGSPPTTAQPFINDNPARCLGCHLRAGSEKETEFARKHGGKGGEITPLIMPYFRWPGWYGAEDDYREDNFSTDIDQLSALSQTFGNSPRYRNLIYKEKSLISYFIQNRPNTSLTDALHKLNSERMARMIRELPEYEKYKYAILAALTDTENIPSYLSISKRASTLPANVYIQRTRFDSRALARAMRRRNKEVKGVFSDYKDHYAETSDSYMKITTRQIGKLRYVIEGAMGQSMKHWAITTQPSYVLAADGSELMDALLEDVAADVAKTDPKVREFMTAYEEAKKAGSFRNYYMMRARYLEPGLASEKEVEQMHKWEDFMGYLQQANRKAMGGVFLPNLVRPCVRAFRSLLAHIGP